MNVLAASIMTRAKQGVNLLSIGSRGLDTVVMVDRGGCPGHEPAVISMNG